MNTDKAHHLRPFWPEKEADANARKSVKNRIEALDDKLQRMLLWSNILTLCACIQVIFTISRLYGSLTGGHPVLLAATLILIMIMLALYLFFVWRGIVYRDTGSTDIRISYLQYRIQKITGQVKLMAGYLSVYSVVIVISGIFFYVDINNGLTILFKTTAPVTMLMYLLGFYFITGFVKQKRKLSAIKKQLDHTEPQTDLNSL
ncbi:hypothetical protein HYN43_004360 [Mucilaginibacter celer]|uniref:DUF3278 domain-containing protein n=2 Tax=Mucilaginibacter celer TaxID=2305508 RepID=A0A494VT64_9SPHI|nr:hypothetical protein HYN43_004360 [Mucilaginibacter celer]